MKVLLTGATGFVGSHILDSLRSRGVDVRLLLRATSSRRFIERHMASIEFVEGAITDMPGLERAMAGVTHVIHCAGATRARRNADYYGINQIGTRHVVEAVNRHAGSIVRLVHISSLAAAHPATIERPAREEDASAPVSDYGKSKLGAEREVSEHCNVPFTILRPSAVYGPRDEGFLSMFKGVCAHVAPRFVGGVKAISLVFVKDLAEATVNCLTHPAAAGRTYFVAAPVPVTTRGMSVEIARQLKTWTLPIALPVQVLWPVCALTELVCRLRKSPSLLNRQKYAELRAPGWVCDPTRLQDEVGFTAATSLEDGLCETISWYKEQGWL